jgi:hypothetical protein
VSQVDSAGSLHEDTNGLAVFSRAWSLHDTDKAAADDYKRVLSALIPHDYEIDLTVSRPRISPSTQNIGFRQPTGRQGAYEKS